ncbi:MAG: TIGR01906 family membrane protein [Lactimicrobium sp.]|jgi:integral membrane protein (TIGR01906 family)|uniref:TIGR01906 family membrane protein n=1 Tax=Lactimicrobium sp. TaxID=2563780 RepID=UPI002F35EE52
MKKTCNFFCGLLFFLLSIVLILSVVQKCCFSRNFYAKELNSEEVEENTGMDSKDVIAAADVLLDYLENKRDDIVIQAEVNGSEQEVFNERETAHMVDVKDLYQKAVLVRNVLAICTAAGFAILLVINRHHRQAMLQKGYQAGISLTLLVIVFLAIWMAADFSGFWYDFHELFFTKNDYWLLNPNSSIMINMFPQDFFEHLVLRICAISSGLLALLGILLWMPWHRFSFRKVKA